MSGPYPKPPNFGPAGAGSTSPNVGGHAPIPPVREQPRRHGAIPPAPVILPRRPDGEAEEGEKEQVTPTERWAYHYRGNAGHLDGEIPDQEFPLKPTVELEEAKPLAVLFYQDTQTVQSPGPATEQNFSYYEFDDSALDNEDETLSLGQFRLNSAGEEQFEASRLYIAVPPADGNLRDFVERNVSLTIEVQYGASSLLFSVAAWEALNAGGIDYLVLELTPVSHVVDVADGPLEDAEPVTVVARGMLKPNAAVRARVRYRSGKSDVQFDCDWAGGFMVHADRLEISRVAFAPDKSRPYNDAPVEVAATVQVNAPRPGGSLSLTVPPVAVPVPTGERYYAFPIHALARRVNLILKYGADPDEPGDAPLGQIFLAFVGKDDRSLCYIDAMSAREALFGAGLPVPGGVSKLVLSNRSPDDTMQLGVVWRLEL